MIKHYPWKGHLFPVLPEQLFPNPSLLSSLPKVSSSGSPQPLPPIPNFFPAFCMPPNPALLGGKVRSSPEVPGAASLGIPALFHTNTEQRDQFALIICSQFVQGNFFPHPFFPPAFPKFPPSALQLVPPIQALPGHFPRVFYVPQIQLLLEEKLDLHLKFQELLPLEFQPRSARLTWSRGSS